MSQQVVVTIQRELLVVLNNVFDIERKLGKNADAAGIRRNIEKIKSALRDVGLFFEDPIDQEFKDTRTDLEATISGDCTENLYVVDVIKPIIRYQFDPSFSKVVQRGVVVVQSKVRGESS